jgi:serine/threonine protein phosphatase 1
MIETTAPSAAGEKTPSGPADRRVYVVGDIHGRADLLAALRTAIVADAEAAKESAKVLIYLGDYVDRGPGSFEVLDMLINEPLEGLDAVFLKGNHEDMMLKFLAGPADPLWLHNGGDATLRSYGIHWPAATLMMPDLEHLRLALWDALPRDHRRFLINLRLSHEEGDYIFVHAGVRPGVPLNAQDARDLMWIREPFLRSRANFGKRVVHGHSPSWSPEVTANRIGIDTGAFYTGCLTCLVIAGAEIGFLHT